MSNLELLNPLEVADASRMGWSLSHVFDLDTSKWRIMILGMPSAEAATQQVIARARTGDPLSTKALRLVMSANKG